jgi:hypothetical protein
MEEATIEAKGLAPLRPQLGAIAAIRDKHDLALCWFSLKWRSNVFRPSGGDFQGIDTTTRLSLSMVASP